MLGDTQGDLDRRDGPRDRSREEIGEALRYKAAHDPIRVFPRCGQWLVDYGSYAKGYHATRAEAIATATRAARDEYRELVVEPSDGDPRSQRAVER